MAPKTAIILKKCPFCNWTFLAEKGDRLHPNSSTKKPKKTDVQKDVITKRYDCRNEKCLNQITVYYYKAKPAFRAI